MSDKPSIDVFLSYHTKQKDMAKTIKEKLELIGFQVFMAPDDIQGGSKFLSVMYDKIKNCQAFLALVSKDYPNSEYSDHEVGIALGFEKPVLPICIDEQIPYGFLREYHCVCSAGMSIEQKIQEIADTVMTLTDTGKEYMDLLIHNLENAGSFVDANHWSKKLSKYSVFTSEHIARIANARLHNSQIYNSFMACPIIDEMLKNQKASLTAEVRTQLSL